MTESMKHPSGNLEDLARASYRASVLIGTTVWLCLGLGFARLRAPGDARVRARIADPYVERWARAIRKLIGMRVRVEGEVPAGPVAIVSNHLSYVDIVALWSVVPGVFVARADVADWPGVGLAGQLIGTIFIDRTRKRDLLRVIPEMEAPLADGRNVIFFPEGTSSRGEEVLPFKSSLFEAAARQQVPVVGASLQFETEPPAPSADWSVAWWGGMTFAPHVFDLLKLRQFEARIRFSEPLTLPEPLSPKHELTPTPRTEQDVSRLGAPGKDRKALCRLAEEAVNKKFIPTAPSPPIPNATTSSAKAKAQTESLRP